MNEKEYDKLLQIKTAGTLELLSQSPHYNRYEATPYEALDTLFNEYKLGRDDGFVDFGCGKARVSFYVHHHFSSSVAGIEMNGQLYQDAIVNLASYRRKAKHAGGAIRFERCLAEEYQIDASENRFYFFNPFSIQVFMKVVWNILWSAESEQRLVDIILYYPTAEYVQFMDNHTQFELWKEIKVDQLYDKNENERFLIYRMGG
ncbi:SAM-dependent methyltransferase [Sporosarcina thermotolerans]|uniref:SAM-dependent methyltransferase n=1 Tax=Sporosarcina thermotolerans TaxID=633404 RepID=A0AAW9ABN8_9BACL|nr:SAM-dependent methyltransferase [Sporosarcina thermotolerans]MDW0116576.1 SAM-dependent methyltransferase [Sporosarcina thermotolerans]WHT48795.1 SAM-dependent methyltransferase [Sporosarcina thermotolerans]